MEYLKKLNLLLKSKDQKNKILVIAFVVLGAISLILPANQKEKIETPKTEPKYSIDTFVPNGLTLVSIDIINANSLNSLLGDTGGVVDLYLTKGSKTIKVASKLKILRAPLNPEQYAVVIPDEEVPRLLQHGGPFVAVVQNPNAKGQKLVNTNRSQISIEYQN